MKFEQQSTVDDQIMYQIRKSLRLTYYGAGDQLNQEETGPNVIPCDSLQKFI